MLFLKYSLGVRPHSSNYLNAVVVEKPSLFYLSGIFHVIFSFLDKEGKVSRKICSNHFSFID